MTNVNKISRICTQLNFILLITSYSLFLILTESDKQIVFIMMKDVANDNLFVRIIISIFILPHTILYTPVAFVLNSYYVITIKYNLQLLNWKIKQLKEIDQSGIEDITYYLDSREYQRKITQSILNLLEYFIDIKT